MGDPKGGRDVGSLVAPPRRSLRSTLPILRWLPRYQRGRDLPADLIAGIAVAAVLIPESIGYSGVAKVPVQVGLYAALGAVIAYAITGSVSILVIGPASAVAALSASLVAEFHGADPVKLTAALAIVTGVLFAAAGGLRAGWVVNFISKPVLESFVAGLSISIIIGQLDGLFRVEVHGHSAITKLVDTIANIASWHWMSVAIGLGAIAALLLLERFAERIPAAVVVVVLGIAITTLFGLPDRGVAIVGEIPRGLPRLGIPDLSGTRWIELLGAATALLLVGFSEGYAAAEAAAARTGESVDADQELVASGAANLAAGLVGGMAVSGSLSKTAAAQRAGARTQVANLVGGAIIIGTLLFLAPVFRNLPEPVVAAVVIVAVLPSADPRRVARLWSLNRLDFVAGAVTFVLVLVWETLPAMIVGVALSLGFLIRRASFPDVVELRRDREGEFSLRGIEGEREPGDPLVLRFEAPLIYANAARLERAALALTGRHPDARRLILDAEMLSDMDSTGAETLVSLDQTLAGAGVELRLARIHQRARAQIARSHLAHRFAGRMHAAIGEAARAKGLER